MKRKEITKTIAMVGSGTFALDASMTLINQRTGEALDIDAPSVFAIIRGTLAWVDTLLEEDAKAEPSTVKNLQKLLTYVGASIAYDLEQGGGE